MTTTSAMASRIMPAGPADGPLPRAGNVLVVTSRPGPESADLGGLLYAFRRAGTSLGLLCLTRGEASPLNATCARLEAVRPWELQLAAFVLGISWVAVAGYPDGGLCGQPAAELAGRVRRAIRQQAADLLLVPDPGVGDPDDTAVCAAARKAGVPVVARTGPDACGAWMIDLGADASTARAIQKAAAAAHESQSPALPQLTRRLDLLDGQEHLRWLVPPPENMPRAARPGSYWLTCRTPAAEASRSTAGADASAMTNRSCRPGPGRCLLDRRAGTVAVAGKDQPAGQAARWARSVAVPACLGGSAGISARGRGCVTPTGRHMASDARSSSASRWRMVRITARAAVIAHPARRRRRRGVAVMVITSLVVRGDLDDWPCVGAKASARGWDSRARAASPRSGSGWRSRWR